METTAILFDTRSIQRYIFSSNRLKTNIGASYLVDRIFVGQLLTVLKAKLGEAAFDGDWQKERTKWNELKNKTLIGYIGGGNALVLLKEGLGEDTARAIVGEFSRRLLAECPGLSTGAAIGTMYLSEDGSYLDKNGQKDNSEDNCLRQLVHKLKEYQNTVFPAVHLPYTGLTVRCPESGEAANTVFRDNQGKARLCSFDFRSKLSAYNDAEQALKERLKDSDAQFGEKFDGFAFPGKLDELGQQKTENYLAIVHIDGNNMGKQFDKCLTLSDRRTKSIEVSKKTVASFAGLVADIIAEYDEYSKDNFLKPRTETGSGKKLLPIRPIVIGGDDVTFVCAAKLALHYAECFMEKMKEKGIYTCGGIAILGTSYPFFRGYELTEQLCGAAKTCSRPIEGGSCWLDFGFLHGEQAPTLEEIRAQEYKAQAGNMHFGPYRVDGKETDAHALQNLEKAIGELSKMPRNKLKELRRVIARGENERKSFLAQLMHQKLALPKVASWSDYETSLWKERKTPYVDAIEMLDYYWLKGGNN